MVERLTKKEKISYGMGNFGICIITTVFSVFLNYFYTNVVGISLLHVGSIMLIGGIMDAISDVVVGALIDRTNSKWGKCRPYLLFMAIPMAVVAYLVFNVPNGSEMTKYIYALVTYSIYTWAYTSVFIPYSTLMSSITNVEEDRLSINMWQAIGSSAGQFLINSFGLSIVVLMGDGALGYRRAMLVLGILGAIIVLICFKNTKERVVVKHEEKIGFKDGLTALNNSQWIIVCVTVFLALTAVVLRAQQTFFYAQYVMNDLSIASKLLAISTIVAIPVSLVAPRIVLKIGKRNLLILGSVLYIVASLGMYFFCLNPMVVYVFAIAAGIGGAIPNNVCYVMTAETIDYGEWKHGKRVSGILMSFIGFSVKIGGSIGGLLSSYVLSCGGYDASLAVQSESAKAAISMNFIFLPIIAFGLIIIVNCFYKLDKLYPQIREDLEKRYLK